MAARQRTAWKIRKIYFVCARFVHRRRTRVYNSRRYADFQYIKNKKMKYKKAHRSVVLTIFSFWKSNVTRRTPFILSIIFEIPRRLMYYNTPHVILVTIPSIRAFVYIYIKYTPSRKFIVFKKKKNTNIYRLPATIVTTRNKFNFKFWTRRKYWFCNDVGVFFLFFSLYRRKFYQKVYFDLYSVIPAVSPRMYRM